VEAASVKPAGRPSPRAGSLSRSLGRRGGAPLVGALVAAAMLATAATSAVAGTPRPADLVRQSTGPRYGGTLYMLGTGDVDYMDPNVSYYTVGYENLRMWERPLMNYPAVPGKTTTLVPDLAQSPPVVSDHGLVYSFTIRKGVMWDTNPPRQVVAADVVRGLERACNPVKPSAALPDYETLVQGMEQFCTGFEKVKPTLAAIDAYMRSHSISGATVDPKNPLTVVFKLTHPATYFPALTTLGGFLPAPVEYLKYLPTSAALAQHTISDGPYQIKSYVPDKSIVYVRNPVWKASTDPISKAYVDKIVVDETVSPSTVQEELQAGSSTADLYWGDTQPPPADLPGLLASHDPNLIVGPTDGLDPFIIFNFADPNEGGAVKSLQVRQGIEYAIDRAALIQEAGGPRLATPLTHVLPPNVLGSEPFDLYPYNPAKAKRLLGSRHLSLKLLYQVDSPVQAKMFQTVQYELSQVGVTVKGIGVPTADIYTKYLLVPGVARRGVWDIAFDQWYPDWYGNNAVNYFYPIFDSASFAPAGANLELYDNPTVNKLIFEGENATSTAAAARIWAETDRLLMSQAVIYPIDTVNFASYHASRVHGAVFVPIIQAIDPTNVWLSS
jgi:peptide/nickel transport system substrate-binding protein